MTAAPPRLLVSAQINLEPGLLPRGWVIETLVAGSGVPRARTLALLVPAEAAAFLGQSNTHALVVVWADGEAPTVDPVLRDHPGVAGVLDARCSADTVQGVLRTAWQLLERRTNERASQMLERVLEVGRALASEKNLDTLLGLILTHARHLTDADGASIYTRDAGGQLFFRLWQNASRPGESRMQKTLVGEQSIAGYVGRSGVTVTLDDAYAIAPDAPYQFNPASDRAMDYRTRSMLTVALKNKADEVVGVLQLINRKDDGARVLAAAEDFDHHVLPFDNQDQTIAAALAGQAGVALENSMLYAEIERLFEGFIRASVQAIEARDPTTAGHSFRVADFTERLALAVDHTTEFGLRDVRFTKDQMRELRYAALLHDFGKVGVRENVLVKAKKLYPHQVDLLRNRFRYARASIERQAWRELAELQRRGAPPSEAERVRAGLEQELKRIDAFLEIVLRANEPSVSAAQVSGDLAAVAGYRFPGENGEVLPLITDFEFADLALQKGSLNPEERAQIESHVSHTYAFLSLIPWTRDLGQLPLIAFAHHEKLDGTGYPQRLTRDRIPVQSRMMTISDIYDALTAGDRPYKKGLPTERALDILGAEAKGGKVDPDLLRIFVECGAWRLDQPA
jgi:HD-GYP domain-containing protein (c-di-GMP phosphodiesterase class II)